jgi:hypothetical protein
MPKPIYRTIIYIDGFNLYYGIKRMYESQKTSYDPNRWREAIWLDVVKLSKSLLNPVQQFVIAKYFTARVTKPDEKRERQNDYLDALNTLSGLLIIEGEYQYNEKECWYCHKMFPNPKEKQSDVNLATELLVDAIENKFDTAIVIAADSDYKRPFEYIRNKYPEKRIEVEFVETNFGYTLSSLSHQTYIINRARLLSCQLPETITLANGYTITRPSKWK